jgi:hypothetical protein
MSGWRRYFHNFDVGATNNEWLKEIFQPENNLKPVSGRYQNM